MFPGPGSGVYIFDSMLNQVLESKTELYQNRLLALVFLGLFVILLIVGGLFFLPSAQIILRVNKEPYNGDAVVNIDRSIKGSINQFETVPGFWVNLEGFDQKKYFFSDQLVDKNNNQILTCRLTDLNDLFQKKLNLAEPVVKRPLQKYFKIVDYKIEDVDLTAGRAKIEFFITNEVLPAYDFQLIKSSIENQPIIEARNYLKALPNVQEVKINNFFLGGSRLPCLGGRIKIKLDII